MPTTPARRAFLKNAAAAAALGLGDLAFRGCLPPVSAADAGLDPRLVRLDSGIEPLVRLIEETPRGKLLEEIGSRVKKGLAYREVVAALFLAGVRNIRPHGGDNFHAVLVIHAAHQASLCAPDGDRWLPVFWALDEFKRIQGGNWRLPPADEAKVPPARKARQAFLDAADSWDADAAESAVVGLVRSAGAGEIFDLLALHGPCNFGYLGHNAIFVSNAWRTLQCIGWQHAEPVLRSLARVVFELKPDALWKANRELTARMPDSWQEGKPRPDATTDLLAAMRQDSPAKVSLKVVDLLRDGVAPRSIWDACFAGVAELLMRQPALPNRWNAGVYALHAVTLLNALRFAYATAAREETRRLLFLQGAALVPQFLATMKQRGGPVGEGRIDKMEPAALKAPDADAAGEVFAEIGNDRALAARKTLSFLKDNSRPQELIEAARLMVFLKGTDMHDYKFSAAVFEDYHHVSPAWRDRYLATGMFILRASTDKDNPLVGRTRAALKT